ncbi:unnamed protein product [Meloidogyne enterolobii]|uniref:Uncharacterized protein n=1 Tax=Meloidogyne enterolobii TaxID=390850 RepID=A0ACB1A0U1_MELEN
MLILIFLILIKYSLESKAEINYLSETNNDLKLLSDREARYWLGSWGDGGGDGGMISWRGGGWRANWGRYNWGRQYGGRYYWG